MGVSDGRGDALNCPACGYELRGQVRHRSTLFRSTDQSIVCPECGATTTLFRLAERELRRQAQRRRAARDATIVLIVGVLLIPILPTLGLDSLGEALVSAVGEHAALRQLGWVLLDLVLLYVIVIRHTATLLGIERLAVIVALTVGLAILPPLATIGIGLCVIGHAAWKATAAGRRASNAQ